MSVINSLLRKFHHYDESTAIHRSIFIRSHLGGSRLGVWKRARGSCSSRRLHAFSGFAAFDRAYDDNDVYTRVSVCESMAWKM